MLKKSILFLVILTLILGLVGCGQSKTIEMNLNDYVSIEVHGNNGHAKAEVSGMAKFEEAVLKELGDEAGLLTWSMIQNKINCKLDKTEAISNGDVITLSFDIDNEYLKTEYNLSIISEPMQINVQGLEDKMYMELNPFEYYEYVISGESPYLTVTLANNDDFGIGGRFVIDYPVENVPFLKNGDTVKVRFEYEADMAEEQCIMVLDGYKEISVKDYPNNAISFEEIQSNNWNQILEIANSLADKTANTDFTINQTHRYQVYTAGDVDIKYKGHFFFKPIVKENSTKIPAYNAIFMVYSFTALNVDSNMPETCYLVLTTYDIKTEQTEVAKNDVQIFKIFTDWDELYHTCVKANETQFIVTEQLIK